MKIYEYTLDGKFIKVHKDMEGFTEEEVDNIVECLNNKKLHFNDRVWVPTDIPLSSFNKKLLIIKNIKESGLENPAMGE